VRIIIRVAVLTAILENPKQVQEEFNSIIMNYQSMVIGRMGLPLTDKGMSVICITLCGDMNEINSLNGQLGKLRDVHSKLVVSKKNLKKRKKKKMRTKRWMVTLGILMILTLGFTGCQSTPAEPQTVNVATLAGPTGMGMAEMIVDGVDLGENVTTEFSVITAPTQVSAGLINGDYQIAALPTNMAAVLYNKTEGKIILGGINTLGVLNIVSDEAEGITTMADLKGKTIVASGQGATPEYVLNYLLEANGLKPGVDVTIDYRADHSEVATAMVSGTSTIAMLPEPFVTTVITKNPKLQIGVDMNKAWADANDGAELQMGCIVVNKEWADANPDVAQAFITAYEKSVKAVNDNPTEGGKNIVEAGIMGDAAIAEKAIPNCNIVYIAPADAKTSLEGYYTILAGFEPKSVGGAVPSDDFYNFGK
jgi:NitT/TauT family transport system substrate-binding protein